MEKSQIDISAFSIPNQPGPSRPSVIKYNMKDSIGNISVDLVNCLGRLQNRQHLPNIQDFNCTHSKQSYCYPPVSNNIAA
jgi:hypothetical protein